MAVQDYKINYKSDFVLNINGDAGWAVPFCIKFWTGMPSQAYFVGFDGVKYVNCRVGDTPTQLLVMFDDHHLPIGPLRMQIAYHTTIEEFPGSVFDEVTNARDVIVTIDGTDYQVLLDFTGEDAPELEFNLPAYANEAERIQNELQRQQNEADRIAAELQREQATAAAVQGAENVNAQLSGNILTVTNRNGVSTSVNTKGEQGEQGPVGPEGPQGEQGPQGEKGDTGATGPQGSTGPQGPKGDTGVSINDFVETGETETDTLYDIEFSDGTTKPVAIPKGEKGDTGEQGPAGPQGPMGDVAVITPEQQAAFTMYSTTGQNTNGPMTQKAVTDALGNIAASGVSYDNSQSGLAAENVQGALDEVCDELADELYNHTSLDVSYGGDYTWTIGTIHSDDGKAYNSSSYYHINIPVEAGMRMKIIANQNTYTQYTFLKDVNFSYGNSGTNISSHYCNGYNNVIRIDAGESAAFTIPEDCNYLYILCGQTSGDVRVPESVMVYSPKLDIAQELGKSVTKVVSQKTITDALEVTGDNLIDMSVLSADSNYTSKLSATKDIENNGVQFSVVAHQTSQYAQGRIFPIQLVVGKTYRLSFEYLNTAGESTISTRNSSGEYIPCASIESKHVTPNIDYESYSNDFIAPEGAYYISFLNLTTGAATKSLTIRNFSLTEVGSLKDKINEIDGEVEQLQEDVADIDNLKTDTIDIGVVSDNKYVSAITGDFVSATGGCHSVFLPTFGASKISVYAPPLSSSSLGIAFYGRTATATFIAPADPSVYIFSHVGEWKWITYDVPEGATMFRVSLFHNTPSKYCLVTPLNYLKDMFLRGVEDMIATQIFRNAKMVSDKQYIYAFAIYQISIVNGKAYMDYSGNRTNVDGDTINNNNEACRSIVDLGDMSHTGINPTTGTIQFYDGTPVPAITPSFGVKIGYITQCPTPNNKIAYFGLIRRNDNNPYYCWAINNPDDTTTNWTSCRLSYNGNTVDFTANNYRQMLVDMGYTPTYIASTIDAIDNVNIHYDKAVGIYYAVLCGANSAFPLVMMQSTDLSTWSPKANLGNSYAGNEIAAIYKDGIAYVIWRIARISANNGRNFIQWRIYDVANSTLISEGSVPGTRELDTKPDCFIFENNVYFAANVNPSVFGEVMPVPYYQAEARSEIVIYKIVDNMPVFFRRVCNPTGIDYFSFMEINPIYAPNQTNPIKGQNSIYVAFSEDRRHLYMRQIAQVSFADVTALFADFSRIV